MNLTTPQIRDFDSVFPAENWFLYWKTTSGLWKNKLEEFNSYQTIFVPINWGMHIERPNEFDFAKYRPETNLGKLFHIAQNLGKKIIFVLPLGPSPFLTNGGLPSFLARTPSLTSNGIFSTTIDFEGRINKLYSFFDPRVFQNYRKFLVALKNYFNEIDLSPEIFIADYGYFNQEEFVSYFEDRSKVFYEGLDRYLDKKRQGQELITFSEESLLQDYTREIKNLYRESFHEILGQLIGGEIPFSFIGGSEQEVFSRSSDLWEMPTSYFKPLFKLVTNGYFPVSTLVRPEYKSNVLLKSLKDIVNEQFIQDKLKNHLYDSVSLNFKPLYFFDLFTLGKSSADHAHYNNIGLIPFLDQNYKYLYRKKNQFEIDLDEDESHSIYVFKSDVIDTRIFNDIIKLFLNGNKIIIDTSEFTNDIRSKFYFFFQENNINLEKINYITNIERAFLGDSSLLLFDGSGLKTSPINQRRTFWENVFKFFNIHQVKIQADEDVFFHWKFRSSSTYELSYEEIRRISIYNPTSYRKKVHLFTSKNFAYLKTIDAIASELRTSPLGVDVDLNPGGSISIDFGFFEYN